MGLQIVGYGEVSKEKIEGQMFYVDIDTTRTFPDRCKEFENDKYRLYLWRDHRRLLHEILKLQQRLREQLAELAGYHYYDHFRPLWDSWSCGRGLESF